MTLKRGCQLQEMDGITSETLGLSAWPNTIYFYGEDWKHDGSAVIPLTCTSRCSMIAIDSVALIPDCIILSFWEKHLLSSTAYVLFNAFVLVQRRISALQRIFFARRVHCSVDNMIKVSVFLATYLKE